MNKSELKTVSFRKIPLFSKENQSNEHIKRYVITLNIKELKETNFPTKTNPRKVNLNTEVAKAISSSLEDSNIFQILNRGIFLSAKKIRHENETGLLEIDFGDRDDKYGIVDGGHTYQVIKTFLKDNNDYEDRFVNLEVFTGLEELISDFAEARNTSNKVPSTSILNLQQHFKFIQDKLKTTKFGDKVVYKQYDDDGIIDIREILAIMQMFRIDIYDSKDTSKQPIQAYSGKEFCVKQFDKVKNDPYNSYKKMIDILPEILSISDYLKARIPAVWNKELKGSWGNSKLPKNATNDTFVFDPNLYKPNLKDNYHAPRPFWLPILASLRVLIIEENNKYKFSTTNLRTFIDSILPQVVLILKTEYSKDIILNSIGKDKGIWQNIHSTVLIEALKQNLIKLN